MVKAYLRYEPGLAFGVIASLEANICYDGSGKLLLAPALDKLGLWNLRQGLCSKSLSTSSPSASSRLAITCVASSLSSSVATGHADGSIRIWDSVGGTCETTLNGHKGAVSALRFNQAGSFLASGSQDNDIILWDLIGEAGLFRLRGHRDQVTDLVFLDTARKLVSCSKDKFVRVWDLETQHCMQTVGGHHTEVWSLDADPDEKYLVTGSADPEIRFYHIRHEEAAASAEPTLETNSNDNSNCNNSKWEVLKQFGEVKRQCKDRVATVRFNRTGNLLACQMAGKTVEIYRVLDDSDSKRKAKRRINRKKEKAVAKGAAEGNGNVDAADLCGQDAKHPTVTVSDVFKLLQVLRASKKICSAAFCPITPTNNTLATLALSLNNNTLEAYSVQSNAITRTHVIELQGHRSDIRSVALSSDSTLLMSTSHNAVKIWNPGNGSCLRTIESGYGLCSSFIPGNQYALVGTKSGTLEIIDVGSSSCAEVVEAHGGSIRSIALIPDGSGFVTGGADHDVKFWECHQMRKSDQDSKHLSIKNVRTLKMNDDVLVVSVSPDSKYIAASLIDCTVRVFFMNSLRFFLSLYGHKLPVLCMDISSEGDLMVTGSADKNLKIWGLDFGDCHKSIFAHADSVMAVQFVHNTHYMFSVGKDHLVKYWDVDKFELLLTLEGHHAEIWCLAISYRGDFIITGSHDRSIRRWDRTEEPFFIEEEREKILEEMFEADLGNLKESTYGLKEELPEEGSVALAGKKTKETLTAADSIIDALDTAQAESKRIEQHKEEKRNGKSSEFQPNIMMHGLSPSAYVLNALSSVHANDLEQTVLSLMFSDVLNLMSFLKEWAFNHDKVELVCRVTTLLLQTHHNQLITTPAARPVLLALKDFLHERVKECKDVLGFNLAAMDHLKEMMSMRSDAPFRDAKAKLLEIRSQQSKHPEDLELKERRKKKKNRRL